MTSYKSYKPKSECLLCKIMVFSDFLSNCSKYKNPPHGSFRYCYKEPTYPFWCPWLSISSGSRRFVPLDMAKKTTYNFFFTYAITSILGLKWDNTARHTMIFLSKRYNRPTKRNGTKSEPKFFRNLKTYKCKWTCSTCAPVMKMRKGLGWASCPR